MSRAHSFHENIALVLRGWRQHLDLPDGMSSVDGRHLSQGAVVQSISWFTNATVAEAIEKARSLKRPLLVDFWSTTCKGCAKLFATTYQSPAVQEFLAATFICVKFNTKSPNDWFRKVNGSFAHMWHPDLVILDWRLNEVRRFIGYLGSDDLVAQLSVGAGLVELYHTRAQRALEIFERVVDRFPHSGAAPEALYWAGVAAYRAGGGLEALTPRWEAIHSSYPTSEWSMRADCLDVAIPDSGFDDSDLSSVRLDAAVSHAG